MKLKAERPAKRIVVVHFSQNIYNLRCRVLKLPIFSLNEEIIRNKVYKYVAVWLLLLFFMLIRPKRAESKS